MSQMDPGAVMAALGADLMLAAAYGRDPRGLIHVVDCDVEGPTAARAAVSALIGSPLDLETLLGTRIPHGSPGIGNPEDAAEAVREHLWKPVGITQAIGSLVVDEPPNADRGRIYGQIVLFKLGGTFTPAAAEHARLIWPMVTDAYRSRWDAVWDRPRFPGGLLRSDGTLLTPSGFPPASADERAAVVEAMEQNLPWVLIGSSRVHPVKLESGDAMLDIEPLAPLELPRWLQLTETARLVLTFLLRGFDSAEIPRLVDRSESGMKKALRSAFEVYGVRDRTQLVVAVSEELYGCSAQGLALPPSAR